MLPSSAHLRYSYSAALVLVQFCMCFGSLYLKLSLGHDGQARVTNPIIFALYRELAAGFLLITATSAYYRILPQRDSLGPLAAMGLCLYFNQLLYILGLKLAGVLIATCMQPSIPIFTVALAILCQQERGSYKKLAGITLATAGSGLVVFGATKLVPQAQPTGIAPTNPSVGALCLVGNCFAMACYFIISRRVASRYPPVCLTAWAYGTASVWMGATAVLSVDTGDWYLPHHAYGPLLYWIFVSSIVGYSVMTCSTRYLPATHVSAFVCLQPFFGSVMAVVWLGEKVNVYDLGGIGVIVGLLLVLLDRQSQPSGDGVADYSALPRDGHSAIASLASRESSSFMTFLPVGAEPPLASREPVSGQALRLVHVSSDGSFAAPTRKVQ